MPMTIHPLRSVTLFDTDNHSVQRRGGKRAPDGRSEQEEIARKIDKHLNRALN
jgi:hypothetical protein